MFCKPFVDDCFFGPRVITSLAPHATSPHYWFFWVNLFKTQNKLISCSITWIGLTWPQDPYFKRQIHGLHFLFINWDHNPTTLSTSIYELGLSNESKLMAHITSLTLMASGFLNKSPYLHKITTKTKVCHLIFGLWPKLISLFWGSRDLEGQEECSVKFQRFKVDKRNMLLGVSSPTP